MATNRPQSRTRPKTSTTIKVNDVAKKYKFPLPKALNNVKFHCEDVSLKPDPLVKLTKEVFTSDPFASTYLCKLTGSEHAQFTEDIMKLAKPIKKASKVATYPVVVKTTASQKGKIRSKFELSPLEQELTDVKEDKGTKDTPKTKTKAIEDTASQINPQTLKQETEAKFKDKFARLLEKIVAQNIIERSTRDRQDLFTFLRPLKAFSKFPNDVLEQLCMVGSIVAINAKIPVSDPASINTMWFCVLDGTILLQTSKSMGSKTIKYNTGDSFGSLEVASKAIIHSAIAYQDSIIFRIDSHEYFRILNFTNENAQKSALVKFKGFHLFEGVSPKECKMFSKIVSIKQYVHQDAVVKQGDPIHEAAILFEGTCDIYALCNGERIKLGSIREGDYFGEQLWLKEYPKTYNFSIYATSPIVKVAFFSHMLIQHKMVANTFTEESKNEESLLERKYNCLKAVKKKSTVKRQLIALVREFTNDPRIKTLADVTKKYEAISTKSSPLV